MQGIMFDMFNMLGRITEIQDKMAEVKASLKEIIIEETDSEGLIKVRVAASRDIKDIILSEGFRELEKEEQEDRLTVTLQTAIEKAGIRAKAEMKNQLEGIVPNIPGLDWNNLPI